MTTIAANRKTMAGDTLVDCDGTVCHTDKIFRIGDNIVGVAGNNNYTTKFLAWMRKECPNDEILMEPDDDKGGFLALMLNSEGLFLYTDLCDPDRLHDKFFAIGVGAQGAMIAMRLKQTPRQAVTLVREHSKATGGRIQELHLTPGASKKGKTKYQRPTRKSPPAATTDKPESASVHTE